MARVGTRPARWTPRALLALAAATTCVWLTLSLGPGIAPATAACPHARAHPHDVQLSKIRKAITCLVDKKRARRDRHQLEPNERLKIAARRHTRRMLAQDCFRHRCEDEPGLHRRVRRSGYAKGQRSWRYSEIIGYENTPSQMIERWMNTRFNRRMLLHRDFRDLGVGVGWGAPAEGRDDSDFATYTIVFGWRKPLR
ncbi:MAG: CAP domain-containing protein [Actinomycetota bacterium]